MASGSSGFAKRRSQRSSDRTYISMLERGMMNPSFRTIMSLATELDEQIFVSSIRCASKAILRSTRSSMFPTSPGDPLGFFSKQLKASLYWANP
jgi:hypothetical protein